MHVEEHALQQVLGSFLERNLGALDLRSACQTIVGVMPALFEADGSGLLLVDDAHVLRYVASTDAGAQLLEATQESTGRGPCVESLVEGVPIVVPDLLADDRWPDLASLLASNGVRAVIGVPVRLGGVPVGSLNVYSSTPRTWEHSELHAIATIESVVERVLRAAVFSERQEELIGQLQRALEVRVSVERAVGVVMALESVDAQDAFERIRRAARSGRRSVRDVAADVIEYHKVP